MATLQPPATNTSTKFTAFSLTLANGATVTGISHIATSTPAPTHPLPLIIGIHGGTCTAHNFDINPSYTASLASSALGVPFVAINRPGYLDSTPVPIPADSGFHRETGRWEHEFIFPLLWEKFGRPNGCTGIVPLCHSMGVPGAIVAASLWADETSPKYPLAGLIFSGWGTTAKGQDMKPSPPTDGKVSLTPVKRLIMLSEDKWDAFSKDVIPFLLVQDVQMPIEESLDIMGPWWEYGPRFARAINVPIMYGMGEHDWLWEGSKKYVKEFEEWFPNSPRFDGSTVLGAPHALEWGRISQGWYVRCFGWAIEVVCGGKTAR